MKNHHIHVFSLALLAAVLSACAPPQIFAPTPTLDVSAIYTQVAASLTAVATQTTQATQTPWVVSATPSNTFTATNTTALTQTPWIVTATFTNTPVKTSTPTKTNTPVASATPQNVCNRAELVAHVTIPPGTFMAWNKHFTKTWRIRNTGTCTWNGNYDLVFSSGTNMAAKNAFELLGQVSPGETVDISIEMVSPKKNDEFTSNWMLRSGDDKIFGLTSNGSVPVSFKLLVSSQVNKSYVYDFAADACQASWSSDTGSLPCPGTSSGNNGFVIPSLNPFLESRHEDEPGLWMRPDHNNDGYVRGVFPLYKVSAGDHFVSYLSCFGSSENCSVRFTLSYLTQNGVETELGSWNEKYDGQLTLVNIDLTPLAGMSLRFVLSVEPNNQNFAHADGVWFLPSIRD